MELKPYQQKVLNDLDSYLGYIDVSNNYVHAFDQYWEEQIGPYNPLDGKGMEPYRNDIPGVPHVCIKVPTAGGKTFIAVNAIEVLYRHYPVEFPRTVIWLVPSITILDQTIRNLSDPGHPYRQKLNTHFNSRVEIFRKDDLLQGTGFNATSVREQLNVLVLSFDTLRSRKKEDKKIYQENGQLASFTQNIADQTHLLEGTDETALINVIRQLKPVVIVDEAHGAVSELSVEMLRNLNPSFILDLTATPRKTSNIISFVDALELKRENMVKLPVIVYNNQDRTGVIESAINLQRKLEADAQNEHAAGGKYIRPIVLFQAQPKTASDNMTFNRIKSELVTLGIPEAHIKIKTADINEIRDIDLMSSDCEVRYIITVNALKEGWDCPFAYILASLADKSSAVDVEQILGRVLRQPYVKVHKSDLLNCSFVLTASSRFMETLDNIVKGLNRAGFSNRDFKVAESTESRATEKVAENISGKTETITEETLFDRPVNLSDTTPEAQETLNVIAQHAISASREMESLIESDPSGLFATPSDISSKVNTYPMREHFAVNGMQIKLPMFFVKVPAGGLLLDDEQYLPLNKDSLLNGFRLSQSDSAIIFDNIQANLYKVDLEKTRDGESTPTFSQLANRVKEPLVQYLLSQPRDSQLKQVTGRFVNLLGNYTPIPDKELREFVSRIVSAMSPEQIQDALYHELSYRDKIRSKIKKLSEEYAEAEFDRRLDNDQILLKETFSLLPAIQPGKAGKAIAKSLYATEAWMNDFEERVIAAVAQSSNVEFWHRNMEDRGFKINGFINHYPDFIVRMKSGKILLIETKGDHLDGGDSKAKIRLGQKWAAKAGNQYRYYMVFDSKQVENAITVDELISRLNDL